MLNILTTPHAHIWTHISGVDPGSAGATPPARGSLSDPGDHRVHISFCGLYIASRSTLMCVSDLK